MSPRPTWTPANYPPTPRSNHVDVYKSAANGEVSVPDPYQWLEKNTDEVNQWITTQGLFARSYLDQNPDRQKLEDLFRTCTDYPKFSAPTLLDDGRWYWFYNSGLQGQPVIYRSKEKALPDFSKDENEIGEVFFDPNMMASDGNASMPSCRFSRCGRYFAYRISLSGNDYSTIFVRCTASPLSQAAIDSGTGDNRLPDEIKYVKFSTISWTNGAEGFFYSRYPPVDDDVMNRIHGSTANRDAAVYYHFLGTSQSDDILILHDKEHPEWFFGIDISDDGKYLFVQIFKDTSKRNCLWVAEIDMNKIRSGLQWRKIVNEFSSEYKVVASHGSVLYIQTDEHAPKCKVVTVDLSREEQDIRDFIPEHEEAKLTQISRVNKTYFVVIYKRNVKDEIYLYSEEGTQLARLAQDFVGTAWIVNRESQSHFFIGMSGFNMPGTIAHYDFAAAEGHRWSILRTTKVNKLNPDDFESQQVWYESKDGTKVPMFIVRHKSTKFDGSAPAIQFCYGGFGTTVDPFFSPTVLAFLQAYGAIFVVVNIRGGGEFGNQWYRAASRENKSNGFDDFIAASEYLVKNKYAAKGKIAINGYSNGGMLVGGSINRAPEGLIGAAVAENGLFDFLRFCNFTFGPAWRSEFGDPNVPGDFDFMYPISPVHNVPRGRVLPAVMIMTTRDDERVVPMHSYKFTAQLQHAAPNNPNPLIVRISEKGGHGNYQSTEKSLADSLDRLGFIAQALGLVWREAN